MKSAMRICIIALALMQGAWMVFDGSRALMIGDYVTPSTGRFAGQLGPWSRTVERAGIDPRSTGMKCAFVVLGLAWLVAAGAVLARLRLGLTASWTLGVITLWYLPVGTVCSAIILLCSGLLLRRR